MLFAHRQQAPGPVKQRMRVAGLRFNVDRVVAIQRIHVGWQHQAGRVGPRKPAVTVDRPLHRGAHAIPVAQVNVVAHANFIAVIQGGRSRHRQQQAVEQFNPTAIALHQRRQTPANPQVDPGPLIGGVVIPQVVALLVGHHLQGQLVVVAQEDRPLTIRRDLRGLAQDIGDRKAVFLGQRHVHARHQRKVKGHVAFVAVDAVGVAEILLGVFRPLIGFGQQHAVRVVGVNLGADLFKNLVGFRQVFVIGAIALDQIGNGIQAQAIDAHVQPIAHYGQHFFHDLRIIEVQIRLVGIKPVPEILARHRVPGPVGGFGVEKNNPRAVVLLVRIRPDIIIPRPGARFGVPGFLKPRVLVRGVVDHQFGNHPQAARMGLANKALHIAQRPVVRVHPAIVRDVITVIAPR